EIMGEDLERYLVFYADQRGGGRRYGAGSADPGVLADDVRAVLDALACDHASLLAHGFGALVAVEVARRWPERVERLVLVAPWFSMPMLADDLLQAARRVHSAQDGAHPDTRISPPGGEGADAVDDDDDHDDAPIGDPSARADEAF